MATYTTKWFNSRIKHWKGILKPLVGTPAQCLEVGSFEGRFALWVVENVLTHPESRMTCVDPHCYKSNPLSESTRVERAYDFNEVKERFLSNTAEHRATGKLVYHSAPSEEALREYPAEAMDFVYIDGSHYASDVFIDAALTWVILKPGGILIFDDYKWGHSSRTTKKYLGCPRVSIDAFLRIFDEQYKLLGKGYQVAIQKN